MFTQHWILKAEEMHNTWLVLVLTRNITESTRDSHSHFYTSCAHVIAHGQTLPLSLPIILIITRQEEMI